MIGFITIGFAIDIITKSDKKIFYPYAVIEDAILGVKDIFSIKPEDLKNRSKGFSQMNKKQLYFYLLFYVLTIAIMLGLIVYTGEIPGCEHAKEMLQ
ncbi:MAG: hypothetical protein AB1465_02140 [Patescibacteria group bacterium]